MVQCLCRGYRRSACSLRVCELLLTVDLHPFAPFYVATCGAFDRDGTDVMATLSGLCVLVLRLLYDCSGCLCLHAQTSRTSNMLL